MNFQRQHLLAAGPVMRRQNQFGFLEIMKSELPILCDYLIKDLRGALLDLKKQYLMEEHKGRINKVMDYISNHLDDDLSLERLAREANFSVSHFHRIFQMITGETVNQYIRRIRVELSANKLVKNPKLSITEIAYSMGFSSSACFAREFQRYFGTSASRYRDRELSKKSKIGKTKSSIGKTKDSQGKEVSASFEDNDNKNNILRRKIMKFSAKVKEMPEMNVVYIRHRGPYDQIGDAIHRVMKWCAARDLIRFPETKVVTVYHDDPSITQKEKLSSDACVTVPPGTKTEGEIGTYVIPGGKFAVASVEITADEFGEAWDKLVGEWIPEHGYQSDERPCYDISLNDPKEHPEGKFIVDICEPIKPL